MKKYEVLSYLNKIIMFYFPNKASYSNSITPCQISSKPNKLGGYYLDFTSKANYKEKINSNGIPLSSYKGQNYFEHPTVIAQYALGIFELLHKKNFSDDELRNKFIKIAWWFDDNKVNIKDGKGWLIDVLYPDWGVNKPWISAMTQGEVISVLSRAALLSKNEKFEKLANEALVPFDYHVNDGGIVNHFHSISIYEEAPIKNKTTAVLNGFIFSLFGLYDLILLNNNEKANMLFKNGVNSLIKLLPFYDINNWTRYRLMEYPKKYYSSYTYHILVIEQLRAMYYLTGEKIFYEYSKRWFDYSKNIFNKTRALFNKLATSNDIFP